MRTEGRLRMVREGAHALTFTCQGEMSDVDAEGEGMMRDEGEAARDDGEGRGGDGEGRSLW
jgi:hypothetical protein